MISKEDDKLIKQIITDRNLKEASYRRIRTPITKYLQFHDNKHTMTYYLKKALQEQEKGIPPHKSWLYKDLHEFRVYMSNILAGSTVQNYMTVIREVYSHNDVLLADMKPFKFREPPPVTYKDIPSHDEIRQAVNISDSHMRALILFQSSSGTTLHESCTITVGMFARACGLECTEKDVIFELNKLRETNIVPIFNLERVKTNKYYYTCCSPEATNAMIEWILIRDKLGEHITFKSRVFPLVKSKYTYKYQLLNEQLGLGVVGRYGKFRSHAMRKFHASNLGCSAELIDELQGRGKSQVHEAYIKDKPQKIKEEYLKYMGNILLFSSTSECLDEDVKVEEIPYIQPTETENNLIYQLVKEIGKLEARIETLEQIIEGEKT